MATHTADRLNLNLTALSREIAEFLEWHQLPVRSIYLDPGIPDLLPVRGYIRVSDRSELDQWAAVLGAPVTAEHGPLPHQAQEYVQRGATTDAPYEVRVYFTRRATDAEVADR